MFTKTRPWLYVPTLYFAEGLPYAVVNTVSVVMYKNMGMSNEFIGLTSVLYVPWVIKMFWSPVVDVYGTRRRWLIGMQCLMAVFFALTALSLPAPWFAPATFVLFIAAAFASATNDVATDGYYMLALEKRQQALLLGVRSTCYRVALIVGSGALVVLTGRLQKFIADVAVCWSCSMTLCAIIFAVLALLHRSCLPFPARDRAGGTQSRRTKFGEAFTSYIRQRRIGVVIAFILVYRLGESLLLKMAAPFLLDRPDAGGLGLATDQVGFVYGTVGLTGLCVGGLIGGWAIARWGLRRCIWPMALMLNAPHLLYVYMAAARPELPTVFCMVTAEQIGYGFGFSAFTYFLMDISREPYATSHFAISTGCMALGMLVPGLISGYLQSALGYQDFFIAVVCAGLPGIALIPLLPIAGEDRQQR